MHDAARQKLCDLVARHGRAVCAEPRRCEALLRDYCGEHRREVFVLLSALREQVAADLIAAGPSAAPAVRARLALRLHDQLGIAADAARWAVDSWAMALHRTTPDAPSRAAAAPPGMTITVSGGGGADYRRIGDALRQAAAGTRVVVRPGFYRESLVLTRPVEIVGDGDPAAVVVAAEAGSCVALQAGEAVVRGLTLQGRAGRPDQRHPAVDVSGGRLVVEDSDLSSAGLSGVLVHGESASAVLRRCRIHDSPECGVYVLDGATADLDECTIDRNTFSGVRVRQANLTLKRCRVHDQPRDHGLLLLDNGMAGVEDCEFFGNGLAGVACAQGSRPVVRRTQVRDGKEAGMLFFDHGHGVFEDCDIFGNAAAGVVIRQGSSPVLRRCRIHDQPRHYGVYVSDKGLGRLEECDISANGYAGVGVRQEGRPSLRACKVHHHARHNGLYVYEKGEAAVEECDISDNAYAGIEIGQGSRADLRRCRIHGNGTVAVRAWQGSAGTVEGCDLADNLIGPWNIDRDCRIMTKDNKGE